VAESTRHLHGSGLRRFQSTGVSAINFGIGVDDFADTRQLFAKWNSFIAEYPQWLRINNPSDLARAKEQCKFGIIFGWYGAAIPMSKSALCSVETGRECWRISGTPKDNSRMVGNLYRLSKNCSLLVHLVR
jgi:hypothetical protein